MKILGAWLLLMLTTVPVLMINGTLSKLLSGDPTTVLFAVLALTIGTYLVGQDIPSINEAVEAAG